MVPDSINAREYLWRKIARSARSLRQVLAGYPVESLVVCEFWQGEAVDSYTASLAAVAETIFLNAPDVSPCAPKVLRVPRVLGRSDVDRAVRRPLPGAEARSR